MAPLETWVRGLRRTPRALGVAILLAWAALIFLLSARPPTSPTGARNPGMSWLMNLCHAPEYGVLALAFVVATADRARGLVADGARFKLAWTFVFLYAVTDEWHQSFTPGRDASVCDVLTDMAGAWLCLSVVARLERGASRADWLWTFAIGLPACFLAALIATFVPDRFPAQPWL